MHLVSIVLINTIELAVLNTMFCAKLEKRRHYLLGCLACFAMIAAYALLAPLEQMHYLFHIPVILVSFLFIGICYRNTFRSTMFLGIASYSVQRIGSMLNSFVSLMLPERFRHFGMDG
ncbi:MAG: hypothetical protein IJL59_11325, partial [Clostridia bacterium]|nr:hypothetical protein [Clostridia bacterium]